MNFIPYKVNEVLENVFYQIPKELLVNPIYKNLDSNSILLYGLLLDRLSVSMKMYLSSEIWSKLYLKNGPLFQT